MKESQIQRVILDYLAAKHILAFRMNTGAMKIDDRFMLFGVAGMADILAFTSNQSYFNTFPVWIEIKTATGKQSDLQKSFQKQVEEHGHTYIVARSIEDIEKFL